MVAGETIISLTTVHADGQKPSWPPRTLPKCYPHDIPAMSFHPSAIAVSLLLVFAGCAGLVAQEPSSQPCCDSQLSCDSCDGKTLMSCETPIESYRETFFQGAEILGGYLFDMGDGADTLDQTFEEVRLNFGMPLGSMDNILGFRPYFRADHLNGLSTIDVPETLYNTGITILNQKKWSDAFSSTLVISPQVRSDFTTSDNAFRLFALAMINWQARSDLSLSLGAVYLDRADLPVLPVVGATWIPSPQWKVDITMPRPRIAHRLWKDCDRAEGWAYVGGTIGGNTWAVTNGSGQSDELSILDLRLLLGYEVIRRGNRGFFVEGGYAFNRSIEYQRQNVTIDLDDALLVEAGWKF